MSPDWTAAVGLVWAAGVAAATGLALWRTRPRRPGPVPRVPPGVLVVRPLAGADPWLSQTLGRLFEAEAPEGVAVRLTVARADDPAWPVAQAVARDGAARGWDVAAWVVPPGPQSQNHKVAQLAGAVARAGGCAVVVGADGDVPLTVAALARLCAPLQGGVGAAWTPVAEAEGHTLGDRASAAVLGGSLHAFSLLGGIDPGALVGKLFAVRAPALAAVGGLGRLDQVLGEDMALAARLAQAGWGVARVSPGLVSTAEGRSLAAVVARFARWLQVIRFQRPGRLLGYPGLFLATGPLLLLAATVAPQRPVAALVIAGLALAARVASAMGARRRAGLPVSLRSTTVDLVLAETVLWAALGRALTGRTVAWRGRRLQVGRAGRLTPV